MLYVLASCQKQYLQHWHHSNTDIDLLSWYCINRFQISTNQFFTSSKNSYLVNLSLSLTFLSVCVVIRFKNILYLLQIQDNICNQGIFELQFEDNICNYGIFRVQDNANTCILGIFRVYGDISRLRVYFELSSSHLAL